MSEHIHIHDDGGHEAVVYLGHEGHVHSDGSDLGEYAVTHLGHQGLKPEHGKALLDSIVHRLDPATLMSARHCSQPECLAHLSR